MYRCIVMHNASMCVLILQIKYHSITISMYHFVSINKMFSVIDKTFKLTLLYEKILVQYGNSFGTILEESILSLSGS